MSRRKTKRHYTKMEREMKPEPLVVTIKKTSALGPTCGVLSAACADAMDPVHTDEKEDFEKQDAERRYKEEYKRAHADRIKGVDGGEE